MCILQSIQIAEWTLCKIHPIVLQIGQRVKRTFSIQFYATDFYLSIRSNMDGFHSFERKIFFYEKYSRTVREIIQYNVHSFLFPIKA